MKILGIETSCDETAIAVLDIEESENGTTVKILADEVLSQIELHRPYGGVFPGLAKREHEKNLEPILAQALEAAKATQNGFSGSHSEVRADISHKLASLKHVQNIRAASSAKNHSAAFAADAIVVTQGPGLEPCLWTGIAFAKELAKKWHVPLIPANHMEGHIVASLLKKSGDDYSFTVPEFPSLALLISGGHTEIVLMSSSADEAEKLGRREIVGKTRDDAVGECFDKCARLLGLPYPGGPEISKLAAEARKENLKLENPLPRPMLETDNLDFSFSGLKTAVLYATQNKKLSTSDVKKFAREIEEAITDVLVGKTEKAVEKYSAESLVAGGGVIANTFIRSALQKLADTYDIPLYIPHSSHATDNALMIALAGYFKSNKKYSTDFGAEGNLSIGD